MYDEEQTRELNEFLVTRRAVDRFLADPADATTGPPLEAAVISILLQNPPRFPWIIKQCYLDMDGKPKHLDLSDFWCYHLGQIYLSILGQYDTIGAVDAEALSEQLGPPAMCRIVDDLAQVECWDRSQLDAGAGDAIGRLVYEKDWESRVARATEALATTEREELEQRRAIRSAIDLRERQADCKPSPKDCQHVGTIVEGLLKTAEKMAKRKRPA